MAVTKAGSRAQGIVGAGRDRIEQLDRGRLGDLGDLVVKSIGGKARQVENDHQMDDQAQKDAAKGPEQEARHRQLSCVIDGISAPAQSLPEMIVVS